MGTVIFDEERLDVIDRDLELAVNGDRDARSRVRQSHLPWMLHFARHANSQVVAYEAAMIEDMVDQVIEDSVDILEEVGVVIGEDSVALPGSPTALAEANESQLRPHQVRVPHDYVMESAVYEAAGGVFYEPGFTPDGGYTAPWMLNETDGVSSETEQVEADTLFEGEEGSAPERPPEELSPPEHEEVE